MVRGLGRTLVETVAVIVVGATTGLAVNALSDKPFRLDRNFFAAPKAPRPTAPPQQSGEGDDTAPSTAPDAATADPGDAPADRLAAELQAEGWRVVTHEKVVDWFHSAEYAEQRVIFVDARADTAYQEGHIPGAYQLDHYRMEHYLPEVLPLVESAETVVVYCNGGECEDSKLAAGDLIDSGVMPSRIQIYLGGIVAWKNEGMPIERGTRGSNDIVSAEAP